MPTGDTRSDVDVARHTEIFGLDGFVGRGISEDSLGMDTGLVRKGAEAGDVLKSAKDQLRSESNAQELLTLLNGTEICTASATKFSTSRRAAKLYLDLTYSASQMYILAIRPPRGVIPFRSPIPSTEVSIWVAPASSAQNALAMAIVQPRSDKKAGQF